jgi:outer membrane murein-binding lipoprotein Lpp
VKLYQPKFQVGLQHGQQYRSVFTIFALVSCCLLLAGCATWKVPAEFDTTELRARAKSETIEGVRLNAAVLSSVDSKAMFGVDVNKSDVQPVWIEIENMTDQFLWLLRAGADPDLFSPLEVAWSFHRKFAGETNARLDEHFDNLVFQNPVPPGTTRSGILYTNPHRKTRLLSIDILGNAQLFPFTLFLTVPDDQSYEADTIARVHQLLEASGENVMDSDSLRQRLEEASCCASSEDGALSGDPINVVLIGSFEDVATALVRRGYRLEVMDFDNAHRLYGRAPDMVARKTGLGGVPANWLRIWVAPFRYQGKAVMLVQAGRPQGWRYTVYQNEHLRLSPRVDEVRNHFLQDMMYSGALDKLAFVTGVGETGPGEARSSLDGSYQTDGLRVVLFLTTRPLSLSDLELLDWYPLISIREIEAAGAHDETGE